MAAEQKTNDHLSFHGSTRGTEDESRERIEWTPAGAVFVLVLAVVPVLILMEVVLSVLVRLASFSF